MNPKEILVVEDNDTMRLGIMETLRREDYSVFAFDNGVDALKKFECSNIPIAVLDLKMEPLNGIDVLKKMKVINSNVEVLMISAYGTVDDAVKAMKLGASDFLTKPFSPDELRIRIKNIREKIENEKRISELIAKQEELIEQKNLLNEELGFDEMIGNSPRIKEVFSLIDQVAEKDSTVLIQGESGTGKELAARAIHKKSKRADKSFVKVNCGALNDNLLESELFGHEKGAFTGAIKQKKGRFELADKGTLFLDEIGDISQAMQIKLLRVLQEGEFERVGGEETIKVNVRLISATNQDLQKLIMDGKFREDLFYRISVIPIKIPSLRERKEDIVPLAEHFLEKFSSLNKRKNINKEGLKLLLEYPWQGNIRELENLVERLCVISKEPEINSNLIAQHLSGIVHHNSNYKNLPLEDALFSFERNLIVQAMKEANGVKNRAAKILGISTSVLYYKLDKFGLI
jgi:two-component system, NtrC family, response regulator HydG